MSLDVYISLPPCSHCGRGEEQVFEANITHNLGKMAMEAGIYYALWRPEERCYDRAGDILEVVRAGLADLKARPAHFVQFDSPNGWGTYNNFVPWVERYLEMCEKNPKATISVSR